MLLTQKLINAEEDFLQFDVRQVLNEIAEGNLIPQEEFIRWLNLVGAYWYFDKEGDLSRPHALLTSGKHSDGFVDCLQLLKYPKVMQVVAAQLIKKMMQHEQMDAHNMSIVSWVFGSPMAGISLAYEMARQLDARHGFTEKDADGTKVQKRFVIEPHHVVLLAEELISTLSTARQQRAEIKNIKGEPANFIPALGVFFNRADIISFDSWPIISLVYHPISNWEPEECPLCKDGSEAIRPKSKENWAMLTGKSRD